MFKRLTMALVVVSLFSSLGLARRNARHQVADLDKVAKRWSSMTDSTGWQTFDNTNSRFEYGAPIFTASGDPQVVTFLAPAAASATAYDAGQSISTTTLVSGTTTLTLANGDYTDMIHPRNLEFVVGFAVGQATTTVTGSVVVTGFGARYQALTETVVVSTTAAQTSNAFSSVTSTAWTVTAVSGRVDTDNALLKMGSGDALGIPANLQAAGDLYKAIEAGALAISTGYTLDTTVDTYTPETVTDGSNNYELWILKNKND